MEGIVMAILDILKWFCYLFTSIVALLFGIYFTISRFDQSPVINEATKTCLITGASSGIGRHIAIEMVKRGWNVIGIARGEEKLKEVERELGSSFIPFVCDVSKPDQVHQVSQQIKEQKLQPTLFFLNAGMGEIEESYQPMLAIHQKTFATNYFGVVAWVDEWLPVVKSFGGGTFVVTSSVMAIWSGPKSASYGASKVALNTCFRSLRLQYRNDGIGFVVVLPGPVDTDMLKGDARALPFSHDPESEAQYIIKQVFKRQKQIEPSWFYSWSLRILNLLPDALTSRM